MEFDAVEIEEVDYDEDDFQLPERELVQKKETKEIDLDKMEENMKTCPSCGFQF